MVITAAHSVLMAMQWFTHCQVQPLFTRGLSLTTERILTGDRALIPVAPANTFLSEWCLNYKMSPQGLEMVESIRPSPNLRSAFTLFLGKRFVCWLTRSACCDDVGASTCRT